MSTCCIFFIYLFFCVVDTVLVLCGCSDDMIYDVQNTKKEMYI